ncbi:MAG: ribonuclease HII [Desulfovibrionales bacterium]|nr:ribonuclease HII [Desulfovibrionales bacterium]
MNKTLTLFEDALDESSWPAPFAGIDEAGRGCLAGPVVAGACILDPQNPIEGLTDSKKLTDKRRQALYPQITEKALAWGIGVAWPQEIDTINILQATFRSMHRAVTCLKVSPTMLAIDGNALIPKEIAGDIPQQCIVKGDLKIQAISAASILAKTFRDNLMVKLDKQYSGYGFAGHKGYGTKEHIAAIAKMGPSRMHRLTFAKVKPEPPKQEQNLLW